MWCESWQHVFFEFNVFVPMQLDDSNDVLINSCHVTLIDGLKICRARHASKINLRVVVRSSMKGST